MHSDATTTNRFRVWTILAVFTVLTGCLPVPLLNIVASADGYERTSDIAYAESPRQRLDVYVPNVSQAAPRPVVLFLYGGGWETGRRDRYRFVAQAMTRRGFVAVIPDYRVYPDVRFPDFVFDAAKAVRWTKDNIARFGGDAERLFLMGHSAGAHIAAMLALDSRYLQSVSMQRNALRGVIGLAGPYDFLPLQSERLEMIFGPAPQRWRSQPIQFVDGTNPPMLLMTGDKDTAVPPGNTHRLAAKIHAHGGSVTVIEYPGMTHAEIVAKLAARPYGNSAVSDAVADFIRRH